jgi:hypothetical protein
MDDATSRLVGRFFPRDTGAANRELLIAYMARHGRMGALYVDRAGQGDRGWSPAEERRWRGWMPTGPCLARSISCRCSLRPRSDRFERTTPSATTIASTRSKPMTPARRCAEARSPSNSDWTVRSASGGGGGTFCRPLCWGHLPSRSLGPHQPRQRTQRKPGRRRGLRAGPSPPTIHGGAFLSAWAAAGSRLPLRGRRFRLPPTQEGIDLG